jgi:hypothetical protein
MILVLQGATIYRPKFTLHHFSQTTNNLHGFHSLHTACYTVCHAPITPALGGGGTLLSIKLFTGKISRDMFYPNCVKDRTCPSNSTIAPTHIGLTQLYAHAFIKYTGWKITHPSTHANWKYPSAHQHSPSANLPEKHAR